MNISYNWLKKYIDFDLTPDEVAAALTSTGLETGSVEEVESIRGGLRGIVIGKVLTCEEHPNSDHLHITTVDLGDGQATQIVCGAPNVAAGQTVVVATVGTTLYGPEGEEFQIKKSKIRGVESFGMICAEDEIGVGTSHDGIIVISEDVKPGTPAAEHFGLTSDYVLEVDLTPNRIDAASHYGVARDLGAWLACHSKPSRLTRPSVDAFAVENPQGGIKVTVENSEACPRYCGVTVTGVTVKESPKWLQDLLSAIGLRPINNIVDITNYLLHAMGQPLHCFDAAKIAGGEVIVRNAVQGAKFVTLDGVEHTLDSRDLMICNTREPMCIAGVFGGLDSGVTESTTTVFLESAYFNPTSVRKTARRHGLNTDSSFRFERGVDPNNTTYVLHLAALMVKELAGGTITGPEIDIYPSKIEPACVTLDFDYATRLVGKQIPSDTIISILKSLEMEVTGITDKDVTVKVPTYRVDVTRPCDVVEDILRIYGYNNVEISTTVHSSLSYKSREDEENRLRDLISEQLCGEGFNEILNNSLSREAYYTDLSQMPAENCVKLLNPLSNDLNVMRQTLLFGGLESLAHNINRRESDLLMYEFGNVYTFNPEAKGNPGDGLAPYRQYSRLAIWMSGLLRPASWARPAAEITVYDMKTVVTNILRRLGISSTEIKLTTSANEIYAAGLDISTRSGKHIGSLGMLAKKILHMTDIKQPVMYAELDWNTLVGLSVKKKVTFKALPKTQAVKRDLALLLDKNVTMERVEATVRACEKHLLKEISLFDVYEGKNLPEGKKSYAITLTLQDDEKTLQDKQIEAVMNKVIAGLTRQLGAQLR
ncbi:phenylalanine--tRNA ligase subunit beta [uncultured Duncaniella sp.]|uniref:phenylalanine--tRNA ligase subunit beta n=1 Tax=uncultured Duncaniella sp. TaxID=2768039 RepID=UPI0025CD283F|nr:phenylalanine--tRNA ligase subunit beta [uncultured Duncaniella sp.]